MAIDEAMLDLAAAEGTAILRLYRWAPHCLSFGCHEAAMRRYDRAIVDRLGLDTVRRPSGGRAVWHADELTYAVAAPAAPFGSLTDAYHLIHAVLAAALRSLGADAVLAPARATPALDAGACFAAPAGGEVLVSGRKVVGSAQVRRGGALLQHGSLLLAGDQQVVSSVTLGPVATGQEAALDRLLGRTIGFDEAAGAVAAAARSLASEWAPLAEPELVARAAEAYESRYRDPAWTWRR
jgi:lipoyl(octanoyl) transferase